MRNQFSSAAKSLCLSHSLAKKILVVETLLTDETALVMVTLSLRGTHASISEHVCPSLTEDAPLQRILILLCQLGPCVTTQLLKGIMRLA